MIPLGRTRISTFRVSAGRDPPMDIPRLCLRGAAPLRRGAGADNPARSGASAEGRAQIIRREAARCSIGPVTIREAFGRACRDTRIRLGLSQQAISDAVGVSRGYIAKLEAGSSNVSVDVMERIADALGIRLELVATPPTFLSQRASRDLVHARCSGSAGRRISVGGWLVTREVDISDGRIHGWIDLLAFDPRTATLLTIEIKTRLDDLGSVERQIAWYERHAIRAAARLGWAPERSAAWLLVLCSEEVDRALLANREAIDHAFPGRAGHMLAVIRGTERPLDRGLAMIDPATHRADWLIRTRIDGRRSNAAYIGYPDAARALQPSSRKRGSPASPLKRRGCHGAAARRS
jgi:transcriptional regulator with XRE-family HTH domain